VFCKTILQIPHRSLHIFDAPTKSVKLMHL